MGLLRRLTALILLILFSPLLLLVAVAIKASSRGPVIYRATRMGKNGGTFTLYKFRTMHVSEQDAGSPLTAHNDPRVTKLGRILRWTKIDELPQLLNVMKSDMAFVGPRPEDPRFRKLYEEKYPEVLQALPGITSPASVQFRHEERWLSGGDAEGEYVRSILPSKLEIESKYLENRTFWSDVKICLKTVGSLLR